MPELGETVFLVEDDHDMRRPGRLQQHLVDVDVDHNKLWTLDEHDNDDELQPQRLTPTTGWQWTWMELAHIQLQSSSSPGHPRSFEFHAILAQAPSRFIPAFVLESPPTTLVRTPTTSLSASTPERYPMDEWEPGFVVVFEYLCRLLARRPPVFTSDTNWDCDNEGQGHGFEKKASSIPAFDLRRHAQSFLKEGVRWIRETINQIPMFSSYAAYVIRCSCCLTYSLLSDRWYYKPGGFFGDFDAFKF
ncbi:hypothetical protein BDZ89DRAFT_1125827 [Hymenopellis radicata]|nr:hypothetical protein BDZ89DRAFT_1125827 [Hymenopellis radicata]